MREWQARMLGHLPRQTCANEARSHRGHVEQVRDIGVGSVLAREDATPLEERALYVV
jgi:hypothetical protein